MTGGLGSGKSTALACLEQLGASVLSTDEVVHSLYRSSEVRERVAERFPEAVKGGEVDRSALASLAFGQEGGREWLEALIWPLVGERVAGFRAGADGVAVVEVPLLFESGMEGAFDHTIAVVSDEEVRETRARARGHEALEERAARQLSQEQKSQRADFTVRNDGTVDELKARLEEILGQIRKG